jgi:hypothetical protein
MRAPTAPGIRVCSTADRRTIGGIYRQIGRLVSGKDTLVERSRQFTLMPWRRVIEKELGRQVSGLVRSNVISGSSVQPPTGARH